MVTAGLDAAVELAEVATRGDRLRRPRGQGRQELRGHRVPLRLPEGQEDGRGHRRRTPSAASRSSPSRSVSCWPSRRSPTPRRPCCSRRSWPSRPVTPSSSARRRWRPHSAERVVEILTKAGEAAGLPAGAMQVLPQAEHEYTYALFDHPGVDLIWTTGGPRIVELSNKAGKPSISVGPGNAPVYLHRTADIRMAVVDILISKTFDGSVICPAEQTCVIDDAIYDAGRRRVRAHGRAAADGRGDRPRRRVRVRLRPRQSGGARAGGAGPRAARRHREARPPTVTRDEGPAGAAADRSDASWRRIRWCARS